MEAQELANRERLIHLKTTIKEWLHIEDESMLDCVASVKASHRMGGDPIWIQIIGASSGGKSEVFRAFHQEGEVKVDDLTSNTFVSGYRSSGTNDIPQFAETLANRIWYIFDFSILMSKCAEERSEILSDMRMVYDGEVTKVYGNKYRATALCPNNTLLCGSTPAIDNTILEDQQLGTRFIVYRLKPNNREAMMDMIDRNADRMPIMREALNMAVREFEQSIDVSQPYKLTLVDNQNLQLMSNMTTLLRTSVAMDRAGEPSNMSYPEEPGRLYKQLKKMYTAARTIGMTEEEGLRLIRKICQDNVNPIRVRILRYMKDADVGNNYENREYTTSGIHTATGLGKRAIKGHLHAMNMIGIVDYNIEEDQYGRVVKEKWRMREANLSLLFGDHLRPRFGKSLIGLALFLARKA
jgi:hypothetical protein